jgi:signal recognition particle receptor subunit beta/predicted  nucleic acid-binding Zn-ribbon protein
MVIYNAATKELTAKIVYYGPGLCGKTTNLKVLHDRLEPGTAGKLLNLQTQTDRTIYFDLLPVELGDIKGYKIRFQLATVPGQTAFNETRRVVLKGVDGIVFVADSQWTMLPKNLESWQNLKDNLKTNEISFESLPVVVQYNKRDLGDILAVDAMQEALGLSSYPFVEAVASAGRGVTETFKLISKLTFVDLLRRLQGRRGEEAGAEAAPLIAEEARQDDLQTWKDSLLNRESQATPIGQRERPSRPLSLVPPVDDQVPFDTTELSRGVDDEEAPSPYAVHSPPEMGQIPSDDISPAQTIQMEAIPLDALGDASEPIESLSEADEIEVDIPASAPPPPPPAPPAEPAYASRLDSSLGHRLGTPPAPGERLSEGAAQAVSALQERLNAATAHVGALAERLSGIEKGVGGLHETLGSLLQRISHMESEASRHPEVERSLRGIEARLADFDERLRSEATHQRKDADDVAMALRGLNERSQNLDQQFTSLSHQVGGQQGTLVQLSGLGDRLPQLESQVARLPELEAHLGALKDTLARLPELEAQVGSLREAASAISEMETQIKAVLHAHHELESTLEEKTQQGRREAEDIRSQIAPLLEERVRRHESDALLFAEMERLRESLAESLHDLAERVRSRIRE